MNFILLHSKNLEISLRNYKYIFHANYRELSITCLSNNRQTVHLALTTTTTTASNEGPSFMERSEKVHFDSIPGKNFAQKFDILLAALSPDLTSS